MKLPANKLIRYWQVWKITATTAAQIAFVNRASNSLFILGKSLRLIMSIVFLFVLRHQQVTVAGYSSSQVIMFYLTYNLVDLISQIFYRGVYGFGDKVRTGEFDFFLTRPISPLFRTLTGQPDINDVIFLVPTLAVSGWLFWSLNVNITLHSLLLYLVLLFNSLLIATGFHILVLVVGIFTTEVDNIIWTYRDLTRLGQFPVTMYREPLKTALFFVVPIGLMMTVPAQILLNVPLSVNLWIALAFGSGFLAICLQAWRWSLRHYTSASS